MKECIECSVPVNETPRTGPIDSGLRACVDLVRRRWAIIVLIPLIVAMAGAQAAAQQKPGMPFIAQKATKAQTLQQIFLTGTIPTQIPASIPQFLTSSDPTGYISTYQPNGGTSTAGNGFFTSKNTVNGRTCFTCHQPQNDWEISPPQIMAEFLATNGKSVLFQPIDSANCPNLPGATARYPDPRFMPAHSQLFNRGNFRIAINAPNPLGPQPPDASYTTFNGNTTPEWVLTVSYDPYGCELDHTYGLYSNQIGVYRRPLNAANLAFLNQGDPAATDIMWDAREVDLKAQYIDATEFHGQTTIPPDEISTEQAVQFQTGMFVAQSYDRLAGDLSGGDRSGVQGGPFNLFNIRQSSPIPCAPVGLPSGKYTELICPDQPGFIFGAPTTNIFGPFATSKTGKAGEDAQRKSIARGEALFNGATLQFTVSDVAGLNDVVANPLQGSCSLCHNNLNVANDGAPGGKRLGIMDNSNKTNDGTVVTVMPITSDFPQFAFYCPSGLIPFFSNPVTSPYCQQLPGSPTTCDEFITTDPGKGLVTGNCSDLGQMKVPVLRGVAARAPYFHGGNAATLLDVVNFYNNRFSIGLSAQQKQDLVNYLNSL